MTYFDYEVCGACHWEKGLGEECGNPNCGRHPSSEREAIAEPARWPHGPDCRRFADGHYQCPAPHAELARAWDEGAHAATLDYGIGEAVNPYRGGAA